MKKMIVIFLGLLSFNTYAYDATRGALQNDPTLCQYGYNPNCGSKNRSAPPTEIIYHNINIEVPPLFAAFALSQQTEYFAVAKNQESLEMAEQKAIEECQKGSQNTPCKVFKWVRNSCLAAAKGKLKNHNIVSTGGGLPGKAEKIALLNCMESGAKECRIIVPETCSIS